MIVLDANILLYAYDRLSPQHNQAKGWLEQAFSSTDPIGLPWQTISAFTRILTNLRLPGPRFSIGEVVEIIDGWLDQPNVQTLSPSDSHWMLFRQMLTEGQASGVLVTDAHLAAITIEYGGVLHTTDRDFSRFPTLRWTNPLA